MRKVSMRTELCQVLSEVNVWPSGAFSGQTSRKVSLKSQKGTSFHHLQRSGC